MDPVHFESTTPSLNPPMVASKIEIPVYVVLEPDAVPDHLVTNEAAMKPIELHGIRTFVKRDVTEALAAYYTKVEVVEAAPQLDTLHVIVDVKITKMNTSTETATAYGSGGTYATAYQVFGVMDWAIALRHSNEEEYFFSLSDHVVGEHAGTSIHDGSAMFRSVLELALARFLERFSETEVQQRARGGALAAL